MTINNLRVNHVENPLGFNLDKISLSWNTQADGEEKFAKSTRVCVSCGDENIYDSGDRENADSRGFRVELNLKPRTKYNWTVEVTADNGEQAKAESSFETGKLNETWKADWISPIYKGKEIAPILEKSFDLKDDFESARLYICGLGLYEVYINGDKAGDEFLAPGYHSYDFHLQAQTIDVSNLLHKGENLIQIYLGDGWFKGRLGFDGGFENIYGDSYYAICELYADDKLVCVTDESWKWRASPIVFSNIYDGEVYDSNFVNFTQTADLPVKIRVPEKCGVLCDRYSLPIVEKEKFYPISVIETPKDEIVLDFGQNITGWVVIHGEIPKGVTLKLTASEIMQDGCFYHDNFRIAKTEFTYHSNGKNTDVRPHFTFYGFRYMKLEVSGENASKYSVNPMNFEAVHLRSDFDEIGNIVTGHSGVNKLFENAMWSQKDNFLDVPTDCPQRDERLGWTGDAQVFSETACMNMYVPAFFRKYLWDMRAEQEKIGGAVPNVVPRLKKGMVAEFGSCPWADAGVIIPWNVYRAYGDKTLLEECYPGMKAWIEYEKAQEEKIEGKHLVKDGFHFADWLALDHDGPEPFGATNPLYIASAYYYYCTNCLAKSAEILGYKEDFEKYSKLASEILSAIRETYFDESGLCKSETQTGSALAIMFGLNPDETSRLKEGEVLNKRVAENNGYLNTGFVGTPLLCSALTCTGHNDTAVSLLLNEDMPSWLYEVNMGATTIWERWNSVNPDGKLSSEGMNSLNHYSYGSIVAWMYKDLVGIKASEAGYKRVKIEPKTDVCLGFADCTMKTASGEYKVSWKYEGKDKVSFEIHVPFDCAAEFSFGNFNENFSCGNYNFSVKMPG